MGSSPTHNQDRRTVRQLLVAILPVSSDFEAFCLDYFSNIYARFGSAMDREAKTNLLLEAIPSSEILGRLRQAKPSLLVKHERFLMSSVQSSLLEDREQEHSQRLAVLVTQRDTLRTYQADHGQLDLEIAAAQRKLRHGPHLNSGEVLAERYQLVAMIGEGAFAQVWEACNLYPSDTIPERVAVKVLHGNLSHDQTYVERFVRGSRQMRRLCHPHIARVYLEASEYQGFHFFVMEHLPRGDLHAAVLRDTAGLQRDKWLGVVLQAGEALAFAHREHCIHRDVRPQNILLDDHDNARLADFDLVSDELYGMTRSAVGLGSADYAAPEQLRNAAHVNERADVFGLGRTALFVYCGKDLPGESIHSRQTFIQRLPLAPSIKAVLETSTAWHVSQRFHSVEAFCNALNAAHFAAESSGASAVAIAKNVAASSPSPEELASSNAAEDPSASMVFHRLWGAMNRESGHAKARRGWLKSLWQRQLFGRTGLRLFSCLFLFWPGTWTAVEHDRESPPSQTSPPAEVVVSGVHRPPPLNRPNPSMIRIQAGDFPIGSMLEESSRENERPAHRVQLDSFSIDKSKVTVAAYRVCVNARQCEPPKAFHGCNWNQRDRETHPVNCINWDQAKKFCEWLGRRLPTEAEWEAAVRGSHGRRYPWGDVPPTDQLCWRSSAGTCPVGSYPWGQTPEGLQDAAGGVKEWVADEYRSCYDESCPISKDQHVVRGSSSDQTQPLDIHSVRRKRVNGDEHAPSIGFRCAQ